MKSFIKKHEYNYILKCLSDLNNTLRNCVDANIVETNKLYIQGKILSLFQSLEEEEKALLDISKITDPLHIDKYLADLNEYVSGMPSITNSQITKLFKKEKKLKLPTEEALKSRKVYLSWIDEATKKLFVVYNMNNKFIGMTCKLSNFNSNTTNICALCNHIGVENEVATVSSICKTSNPSEDSYKSIGFHICLDSEKCNERIVSTEKLEKLLKEVNNLK